ncbi:hypothetical protein J3F84DRAFT_381157 [Trichoderma pleuroticola]
MISGLLVYPCFLQRTLADFGIVACMCCLERLPWLATVLRAEDLEAWLFMRRGSCLVRRLNHECNIDDGASGCVTGLPCWVIASPARYIVCLCIASDFFCI